ncbi:hypothetical protein OIU78_018073 [Salix suchowensis]|nr:hypothetical protein OIU78_018073 [Salix suchowensis]
MYSHPRSSHNIICICCFFPEGLQESAMQCNAFIRNERLKKYYFYVPVKESFLREGIHSESIAQFKITELARAWEKSHEEEED